MPIAKDSYCGSRARRQPGAGLRVDGRARPSARATRNCRDDPGWPIIRRSHASIRAGMICAVIRASTRSLPQPRPPADSLPHRSLAKAGSSPRKGDRSGLSGERTRLGCWFRRLAETFFHSCRTSISFEFRISPNPLHPISPRSVVQKIPAFSE